MPFLKQDQSRFESYLAATHNLTLDEACEALDAFMADLAAAGSGALTAAR